MTKDLDRFARATTYAAYRDRLLAGGGIMRDLLEESERTLAAVEIDIEPFTRITRPLRVLVLSEDWCGDCTDNLPILNRIATESGKLDVGIIPRDEHLDLMAHYLNRGQFQSIPVMIFLDEHLNEIGHFIERPESVTELRQRKRQEVYDTHPEFGTPESVGQLSDETRAALQEALSDARGATRPFAIQEVVRELAAIAARAN